MKFGYVRVSAKQSLDLQIKALNDYGVDEIYEEKITGSHRNRQQLSELLRKLRAGDTLVIWRLDRLGRTVKQLLAMVENFKQKGIHFVSLQETIDTSTSTGKSIFEAFCALAQMERDVISERTKVGMIVAKKSGRSIGKKPIESKNVEEALKMYFSNEFSIKDIIKATGIGKTTIYKYVREHKNNNK